MSFLKRFFAKNAPITSDTIRAEISRAESEITAHRAKLDGVMANVAVFSDSEHVKAETEIATIKRAVTRLEARVVHLNEELPQVIAAEEAAAKAAADAALRRRAEAARKANEVEAKKLLVEYDTAATRVGDILDRLKEIDSETAAINDALRKNPVAEGVTDYNQIHRRAPDQQAAETRAVRKCWIYRYPGSPPDQPGDHGVKFVKEEPSETVREASFDDRGNVIPVQPVHHDYYGRLIIIKPTLEDREIVVGRTNFRPGRRADSLSEANLPPAFLDGIRHWPRKS